MIVRDVRDLQDWTDDAAAAMQCSPAYFAWWSRWKTRALVLTLAVFAYEISRHR